MEVKVEMEVLRQLVEDERGEIPAEVAFRLERSNHLADGILAEVAEAEDEATYDMVVIGASEEWFLRDMLFGSVPDQIADGVPCSVLMVRKHEPATVSWLRRTTGPSPQKTRLQEQMAIIITSNGQAVASRITQELGRGVTALKVAGMYTGEVRDVLLCATTKVQVPHLEKIVQQLDPHAFVVVSQTAKVRGGRFDSFDVPE